MIQALESNIKGDINWKKSNILSAFTGTKEVEKSCNKNKVVKSKPPRMMPPTARLEKAIDTKEVVESKKPTHSKHEIAQLRIIKKIYKAEPRKAYEIAKQLPDHCKEVIPQSIWDEIVDSSIMSEVEDSKFELE